MLASNLDLGKHYPMSRILVCGLGLIGKQRVNALQKAGYGSECIFVYDPIISSDKKSSEFIFIESLERAIELNPTHVIISTPHDAAVMLAEVFLNLGSQVLMEKPMGRSLKESSRLHENQNSKNLSIGFNYRFMPAIQTLKERIESGSLGQIHTIKLDLGHGGSPGDEKSWKLSLNEAGGGTVLDPGVHLLDILNYVFGANSSNLVFKGAVKWQGFWNTGIEESVIAIGYLKETIVNLSVSVVAWKTRFEIEVIGTEGYVQVSGRGRSDGPQRITAGERWGWRNGKTQNESETKYIMAINDDSLILETQCWLSGNSSIAKSYDGLLAEQFRESIMNLLDNEIH